ncbi:YbhB/YbcL family Raf kinase inhibitor-like protein [Haloferax sp. wsp5]|nr:YbhB/YbcL family Raf kinase inhibitor-like protein [Haloferax sp. wsp5]
MAAGTTFSCLSVISPDMADLQLRSPAFDDGDRIPGHTATRRQTRIRRSHRRRAAGRVLAPPHVDDPDAVKPAGEVWDHWLVWNVAPETDAIAAGETPEGGRGTRTATASGATAARTRRTGEHTYRFLLYARERRRPLPGSR